MRWSVKVDLLIEALSPAESRHRPPNQVILEHGCSISLEAITTCSVADRWSP